MSEKELLYIEDALNHQRLLREKCMNASNAMQDRELKSFIKSFEMDSQQLFDQFYSLLK